jgi:outer membrane protein OmpA-like peptidoglycan-associated protein
MCRRRGEIIKLFMGILGAGLAVFAAVKFSEGSALGPVALWVGAGFLTLLIASGALLWLSNGPNIYALDALNRYLAISEGGTFAGAGAHAPLRLDMPAKDAIPILVSKGIKQHRSWPGIAQGQFIAGAGAGFVAGVLLLWYIWIPPIAGWWTRPPAKVDTPAPITVESSVGLTVSLHFERNRAGLSTSGDRELGDVVRRVGPKAKECLRIDGHADQDGSSDYNFRLAQLRSDSVRDALIRHGMPPARIASVAYGKSRPSAEGTSVSSKAQNRRVDVVVEACK